MILSLETYPTRGSLRKVGQYRNQGFRQLFYKNYTIVYTVKDNKKEVHIIVSNIPTVVYWGKERAR